MHRYQETAALHYAAYRPPLHAVLLDLALGRMEFDQALDFGCGTGQSALALVDRAEAIVAVDRSPQMLAQAKLHPRVEYRLGDESVLPVENGSRDLVTFAGVVPYLDPKPLRTELRRVCRRDAVLVPYDFKVDLGPVLRSALPKHAAPKENYDHRKNLNGMHNLTHASVGRSNVRFHLGPEDAAHLVLSNEARLQELLDNQGLIGDLFGNVVKKVEASDFSGGLVANLFWSVHRYEA